jgi:cell wall assembly regulator SMI1
MRSALKLIPIGDQFDAATEREVQAAENALQMSLPPILRELQLKHGRCMFDGEATVQTISGEVLNVFTIFGCKGEVGNCVTDFHAHPEFIARALLPIGDDMSNNRYVWDSNSGNVGFIDYASQVAVATVAESLEEFFQNIHVVPDE